MAIVLSIDPGRDKCGIAVVSDAFEVIFKDVVRTSDIIESVKSLIEEKSPDVILIGSGTGSRNIIKLIRGTFVLPVEIIDEKHSTEQARKRFFAENPPRGIMRLVPIGLQVPGVAYDDYAAIVLAEKYFLEKRKR